MEESWIHWAIFWAIIPITLVFFWILKDILLEKSNKKINRKEMIHSSLAKKNQNVIDSPYPSPNRQHFIISPSRKAIIEKMGLVEKGSDIKENVLSNLLQEDRICPPDIYVINEKGKAVQYIMCV